jgi:formate dehydrogenase subunit gamma
MVNIIDDILLKHAAIEGPLLPILHAVQAQFGFISPNHVPLIAKHLNLSIAEVHGVISFYHDFKTLPAAQNNIQICRAEACQANGARSLQAHAQKSLGIEVGETTKNRKISLSAVYCLGNCACGPSVRIGNKIFARVDNDKFDQLLAQLMSEEIAE